MNKIKAAAVLMCLSIISFGGALATAQEKEEVLDFSRAQLFAIIRDQEKGQVEMALPSKFRFPDHVRPSAVFGVDVSHHNGEIVWSELAKVGVTFAYVKATEGATHNDKRMMTNIAELRKTQIFTGAYHFLRSTSAGADQARNFIDALGRAGSMDMPPVIDLEWQPVKMRDDCPQDAIVFVEENGKKVRKCDLWAFVGYREIVALVNEVADAAKKATGKEPMLYSNAAWWAARIARPVDKLGLHTRLIWIADYSKSGLATEAPRQLPGADWHIWQFSEGARVKAGDRNVVIDANIFPGNIEAFKSALGF